MIEYMCKVIIPHPSSFDASGRSQFISKLLGFFLDMPSLKPWSQEEGLTAKRSSLKPWNIVCDIRGCQKKLVSDREWMLLQFVGKKGRSGME